MMKVNDYNLTSPVFNSALIASDPETDTLDCAYAHGYLVANVISPFPEKSEAIAFHFTECEEADRQKLASAISLELKRVDRLLGTEEENDNLTPDDPELLAIWCAGFLEVHFQQQKQWLKNNEQQVSELLLPFMLLSGLFDEEPDFKPMVEDEKLLENMREQLPEVLVELYLLFRE